MGVLQDCVSNVVVMAKKENVVVSRLSFAIPSPTNRWRVMQLLWEKPSTQWSMSCGPDGATSVVRKRMLITSVFRRKSVPTKRRSLLDPPYWSILPCSNKIRAMMVSLEEMMMYIQKYLKIVLFIFVHLWFWFQILLIPSSLYLV